MVWRYKNIRRFFCHFCGELKEIDYVNPAIEASAKFCSPECRRKHAIQVRRSRDHRVHVDYQDDAHLLAMEMELEIPKNRLVRLAIRFLITAHRQGKVDVKKLAERFGI